MALDLSSYAVASGEKPISSTKQNNMRAAIQNAANNIGDTSQMAWAAGLVIPTAQLTQIGATSGQVLAWNGSAWAPATSADVYYRKVTERDVSTTAETDLFNGDITIAANALTSNGTLRIRAGGDLLNNTGSDQTIRLKLKLGSSTLWDGGTSSNLTTSANRRAWHLDAVIQARASTSSQRGSGVVYVSDSNAATTGTGAMGGTSSVFTPFLTAQTSVDMTTGQVLALTVILSSGSCSMRSEHVSVQVTA